MRTLLRITMLALRFNWASKARFILLTLVVAVGMTTFLLISELSRVSSADLDEAIAQDLGTTGTYLIDLQTDFGAGSDVLAEGLRGAVKPYQEGPTVMFQMIAPIPVDCPPGAALGEQPVMILSQGAPQAIDVHLGSGSEDQNVCLSGQETSSSSVHVLSEQEALRWGPGVVVDDRYERLAMLSSTGPIIYRFVLVTDQQVDQQQQIANAVKGYFEPIAKRYGVDPNESITVQRLDSAEEIRRASAGVKLVYLIIAWGVLILGGLGLLVAELIVVRDRTWFYGLSRAMGGRGFHIVVLILADIIFVLVAGTALAGAFVAALQPVAASFAQRTFQVGVRLLQPEVLPRLVLGELLVLMLAGVMPAWKATRQDPLDVLEPSVT